jgi:hypothetical protein
MESVNFEYSLDWNDYKKVVLKRIFRSPKFLIIGVMGIYLIAIGIFSFTGVINDSAEPIPILLLGFIFLLGIPLIYYIYTKYEISKNKSKFLFEIGENYISWKTDKYESKYWTNKILSIQENNERFELNLNKKVYLVIPKRILNESEIESIRTHLKIN